MRGAATVVTGRCESLPPGEGLPPAGGDRPSARGELGRAARRRRAGGDDRAPGPRRDRPLRRAGPARGDGWAVRRLFEAAAARERPLVVVVDDVHWAEPTLLDLLDYVAAFSSGVPILLVCLAPAGAARAPARPGRRRSAARRCSGSTRSPRSTRSRSSPTLGAERLAAQRSSTRAEGNPLFLEQLVAVGAGASGAADGRGRAGGAPRPARRRPSARCSSTLPSRGAASTAARSRLLMGGDGRRRRSTALVRQQLIRPERPEHAGEDAFRFAHALIREVAYHGMAKRRRAELHEQLAGVAAEQARPGRRGPRPPPRARVALPARARAPGRGCARGGGGAAAGERGARGAEARRRGRRRRAARARGGAAPGRRGAAARARRRAVRRRATRGRRARARRGDRCARAIRARRSAHGSSASSCGSTPTRTRGPTRPPRAPTQALRTLTDDLGRCRAWRLRAWIAWTESRSADADAAWRQAAEHARRAGDDRERVEILGWCASAAAFGPMPIDEAIRLLHGDRRAGRAPARSRSAARCARSRCCARSPARSPRRAG